MNPLLLTGLFSVGKGLLDKIIQPSTPAQLEEPSFESYIQKAKLQQYGRAQKAVALADKTQEVTDRLMHHPLLSSFMNATNPSESISLIKEGDRFSLQSSSGRRVMLPKGSDLEMLANQVDALKGLLGAPRPIRALQSSVVGGGETPDRVWLLKNSAI